MDSNNIKPNILIALPAKNEAVVIRETLHRIQEVQHSLPQYHFDVLVVDDASTDKTREYALTAGSRVETLPKSNGLGHVFMQITKKFLEGGYQYLVTIDADGQFDPKEIPLLLSPLETRQAEFVTGSRFLKESKTSRISKLKKIGNKIGANYVSSILKAQYSDVTCGFRAYTREAILRLHTFSDFTYTQEVFLNLGIKKLAIVEVPITTMYFPNRKSKMVANVLYYILKSFKIILKSMIIYAPMRLFARLCIICFLTALCTGVFVFFWDRTTGSVTPYKWLGVVSTASAITGIIMYSMGILLQITSRIQLTIEEQLYLSKKNVYREN